MTNPNAGDIADALRRDLRAWPKAALERRWSPAALRSAVRAGSVTRMFPGIFAATLHANSFATRAHAAHLWCGRDTVVIDQGAASVWDLADVPTTVVLAVPYGMRRDCPSWLRLRRLPVPVPHTLWGACPVATPAWAAVTSYASAPPRTRDGYLYRAAQSGGATADDLLSAANELPRLKGRLHLEQVVAAIRAGSESHLETTALRRVFNTQEFSDFVRQHWVRTLGGNYRLDMLHAASQTAVELDGVGDHGKPVRRQYDITRDVNVAREGILTLRFSAEDISRRAAWCREAVLAVVAERS